jgi:RNA polymerase sigma factor (sigma-70 family)
MHMHALGHSFYAPRADCPGAFQSTAIQADQRWILRIIHGDRLAAEAFVLRFRGLIYYHLRRVAPPEVDLDDLFQRVFVRLWSDDCQRLRAWRGDGPLAAYLARLVARLAMDECRVSKRRAVDLRRIITLERAASNVWDVDTVLLQKQQQRAISATLGLLPRRKAELIIRKHVMGQTYREISAAMGLTESNVGVSIMRAEKDLRVLLQTSYGALFERELSGMRTRPSARR